MKPLVVAASLVPGATVTSAVSWHPQTSSPVERLRGGSAVSGTVAWASGNKGTVVRTGDGGATWSRVVVPGSEALDFRDTEAFDADTAYVLSIGPGDKWRICQTGDGGKTWPLQFTNPDPKAFYDAIAFWDANTGVAVGDPVDGRVTVIRTVDGGVEGTRAVARHPAPTPVAGGGGVSDSGPSVNPASGDPAMFPVVAGCGLVMGRACLAAGEGAF